jgi:hypothetical protein
VFALLRGLLAARLLRQCRECFQQRDARRGIVHRDEEMRPSRRVTRIPVVVSNTEIPRA